jgi:hypothetical protein
MWGVEIGDFIMFYTCGIIILAEVALLYYAIYLLFAQHSSAWLKPHHISRGKFMLNFSLGGGPINLRTDFDVLDKFGNVLTVDWTTQTDYTLAFESSDLTVVTLTATGGDVRLATLVLIAVGTTHIKATVSYLGQVLGTVEDDVQVGTGAPDHLGNQKWTVV